MDLRLRGDDKEVYALVFFVPLRWSQSFQTVRWLNLYSIEKDQGKALAYFLKTSL